MCQFSITNLPLVQGFLDLKEEDYYDFKRKMAKDMIDEYERVSGVNIHDHIVEIEVSTPVTVAHYVGAWKGSIYGYSHSIDDHAKAVIDDYTVKSHAKQFIDQMAAMRQEAAGSGSDE